MDAEPRATFVGEGSEDRGKQMSTIMLVDDSATILLSISNILTKAGSSTAGPRSWR